MKMYGVLNCILFPHGGSGNHGCEAIVRSTNLILGDNITLFSERCGEDYKYGLKDCCSEIIYPRSEIRRNFKYTIAQIMRFVFRKQNVLDCLSFKGILDKVKEGQVYLSIGGDNYCYGVPHHLLLVNSEIRKKRIPSILWGCSIEPDIMTGDVIDDLNKFDCIIARESLTYNALREKINTRIELCPDPAFVLPVGRPKLPAGFIENNTVGINFSPMVCNFAGDKKAILINNYINLVDFILSKTDMNVAFIPHVVWSDNDDRKAIALLSERFLNNERVCVIEDQNAEQLKGVIAKCRFLVTARTHASIAGYSTGVPTLVLGYSIKAKGIAKDIFGTFEGYVKSVQSLKDGCELSNEFKSLMDNEYNVRCILKDVIPEFKRRVFNMKHVVGDVIEKYN